MDIKIQNVDEILVADEDIFCSILQSGNISISGAPQFDSGIR